MKWTSSASLNSLFSGKFKGSRETRVLCVQGQGTIDLDPELLADGEGIMQDWSAFIPFFRGMFE
jgi:hypothetical protein